MCFYLYFNTSFVINVTSFQPFSLISILLLRLALNLTSHPIDYVYQMWTPGMGDPSQNTDDKQLKIQTQIQLQIIIHYTNTVTLLIMFIKCRRRGWATHHKIQMKIQMQIQFQILIQYTNTVTLFIMFIKCGRRGWATHYKIRLKIQTQKQFQIIIQYTNTATQLDIFIKCGRRGWGRPITKYS